MLEKIKITKEHIKAPAIEKGGTAIVFQRHEKYERSLTAEDSGSLSPESAQDAYKTAHDFFSEALSPETAADTMILFVSSDTQYNKSGHRSMETADQAQAAAKDALQALNIDPAQAIINLNANFSTKRFDGTNSDVRPVRQIREPAFLDNNPDYLAHLQEKYGAADEVSTPEGESRRIGLTPAAWEAHESDHEKEVREEMGAEGIDDILERTKRALEIQQKYAEWFHHANPGKKLIIWSASHYDTISPLVKDTVDKSFEEYVPVDYGAGIVISVPPKSETATTLINGEVFTIKKLRKSLGKTAVTQATV